MLPDRIAPYAKAVVAILGAVVVAVMQAWPDDPAVQQWGGIITATLTAIAVYAVPNKGGGPSLTNVEVTGDDRHGNPFWGTHNDPDDGK